MTSNRHRIVTLVLLAAACLLAGPVAAESTAECPDQPRMYTNADLERHAAPESSLPALAPEPGAEAGWGFVTDHLTRQYRQIDLERERAVERRRAEAEATLIERRALEQRYTIPWGVPYCYGGGAHYDPWCRRHARPGAPDRPADGDPKLTGPLPDRGRITPLHARGRLVPLPTTRGADAVPRR